MTKEQELLSAFEQDVITGLTAKRKRLPSKYFYDAHGDDLFRQIMQLDEYYLTNKEREIFQKYKHEILESFGASTEFRLVELGAGDGSKTKILLKEFMKSGAKFTYSPIDISKNVLNLLSDNLKSEIPDLTMQPAQGDYFKALSRIHEPSEKTVAFFLGSNIGNFGDDGDVAFLRKLGDYLETGDLLFMGVDLKKDPSIILRAYDDSQGITKEFNLNLLKRINRELNGNFDISKFQHYPYYNPQTGECRSYLISTEDQKVQVANQIIHFEAWEAIFMEISKKYDSKKLNELAQATGFSPVTEFRDDQSWYANVLWEKV